MYNVYKKNGLNVSRPTRIIKYGRGEFAHFIALWGGCDYYFDEMTAKEAAYWKRKGVTFEHHKETE